MAELLRAEKVSRSYRTRKGMLQVLDNVSLSVNEGEIVGLVGTSGSGKSTFASIVAGLEVADAGSVFFKGETRDATARRSGWSREYREAQKAMQMVFQHPASSFSPRMKVGAGIEEGAAYLGVSRSERAMRVREALDAVGLPQSYVDKYAWELSGGECQRAAIARSLVGEPVLLIADEPTSALDVTIQAQVVHLLADLCRDRGMACLFISHDLALVQGLCKRVVVLDEGRIVEEGIPDDVFDNPQTDAARRLVASIVDI